MNLVGAGGKGQSVWAARAEELQCTDFGSLLSARADQLEADADNGIGQLIISSVQSGEDDVFSRLSR